jgi:hypothetical protein
MSWGRGREPEPWYLNGPEPDGGYEAAGIPPPMVPGVQPWEYPGEAGQVGEPVEDDWRRERLEEVNAWVADHDARIHATRCTDCGGSGCGWCGHTGWVQ